MRGKSIAIRKNSNVSSSSSSSSSKSVSISKKRKQQQQSDTTTKHNYHFKKAKATCLKCNKSGGTVLPCVVLTCPIAFHKKCAQSTVSDVDGDTFYCPYCAYARYLSLADHARQAVSNSKKLLSRFLDTTTTPKVHPPPAPVVDDYRARESKNVLKVENDDDDIAIDDGSENDVDCPANLPLHISKCTIPKSCARGKRVLWSPQEEEMLMEGIRKFASHEKSIPWREILQFGRHIFDKSRNSESLRNKWKNNLAEDCCPYQKGGNKLK